MDIPAGVAASAAQTRLALTQNMIKQNADSDKSVANLLQETIENAPQPSGGRGSNVNIVV